MAITDDVAKGGHWDDVELELARIDSDNTHYGACEVALLMRALRGRGEPPIRLFAQGALVGKLDEMLDVLRELGGRLVHEVLPSALGGGPPTGSMFAWSHGVCTVSLYERPETVCVSCVSTDRAFLGTLHDRLEHRLMAPSLTGRVHVVVQGHDGPKLVSLGAASVSLERDNYDESVLKAFDHVVADLASASPCGRLVLIDGAPGTGKSFVVRGLLAAHRQAGLFVVVPPDIVRDLSGPTFLRMLLRQRYADHEGGNACPIVLVLEDADECLAPRMADNIGSVANMLAFGDGIIGSVLDVRMIATTNRPRAEIDDALLRAGRLCRRIPVGLLDPPHAMRVFTRLTGHVPDGARSGHFDQRITLADVYAKARG